ncbi:alpha/beta fold hydrolase [Caldovatus aquaticus]|uniref:Alpha/beta fold hydrolase n=1 Tax=Caldovatus aquaticus TaxID=2865671 RepID=A0ABS7EXI4_9PROT|nr:alpha/beta fold hydrolase [Caldovatus aquaticus]MBW8267983.1 alpha/beta fold hydrolase [Caldovatus aquaticus]
MTETWVQAKGARLYARADGREDAPAILLCNSLASDHTMWDAQVPLLSARYRVLRYDRRGHGRSEAPEGPYSLPMLVADALAVLDRFGVRRAAFMGLSLGGMTGIGLCLAHPERVERLVCCDCRADAPEPFRASWDERIATVRAGGMQAVLQPTIERWLRPAFREADPAAVRRVEAMILGTPVAGYEGCARAIQGLDYFKDLGRMRVPTLYVTGEFDAGAPPEVMRAMAEATPGGRLAVVPGSHHLPNIDNEAGFAAAIGEFLGLR